MYNSIDNCPIVIYSKIQDNGDLSLLGEGEKEERVKAWSNIQDECLETYGVSKEFELIRSVRLEIVRLKLEILKGAIYKKPILFVKEQKLKELMTDSESDIYESIAILSQTLNFQLDRDITIREFYAHHKVLSNRK